MDRRLFVKQAALGSVTLAVTSARADAATGGDSAATGRRLAQRFAATLSAHDIDAFAALFAEDYQQHQALVAVAPPTATSVSAKEGAVRYFGARIKAFPDLGVTADPIVASKGWVTANFIYSGTQQGDYLGVPATGKHVTFNSTDILRVEGGRFVAHWGAADLNGLMQQLKG
jgi:steroid delta-isomerase-like uncharacterized protein